MKLTSNEMDTLIIHVDASVTSNNCGGVGVRIISLDRDGNEIIDNAQSAGYQNVNSGQMEIIACAYGLEEAERRQLIQGRKHIIIYTDSKHVYENYRKAMYHWIGNRWLWKDGRPVADANEWKQLVRLLRNYSQMSIYVEIKWVKGHHKNEHNVAVDKLAKEILRLPSSAYSKNKIISVFRPRQIKSPRRLEIGSVKMSGQKVRIQIIGVEYLRLQKLWGYKYTVLTKKSPYFGCVDKAYASISLDTGKSYYVRFNKDTRNPRIEKMYWEVEN